MSVHFMKTSHRCRRRSTAPLRNLILSLGLMAAPQQAAAQIVPVCDRSPVIVDAIVRAVPLIYNCAAVTGEDLGKITDLPLAGPYRVRGVPMGNVSSPIVILRPGDFSGLTSLRRLDLKHNALENLPPDIFSGLSSLEHLDLGSNRLTQLPPNLFAGLASLTTLWLDSNHRLGHLPKDIFSGLASLETLVLRGTPLTSLSEGLFSGLSSLKGLFMGHALTHLPEGIFSGLASLEILSLSVSQPTHLPEGIFSGLASLETLNLDGNQLTSLPEGVFSGLASLEILSLSVSQLTHLPEGVFSGLASLETLSLSVSQLTTLPGGIFSGLASLKTLQLFNSVSAPLPINVSLEWVDPGRFQARMPTGAPFEIRIPITVTNGTLDAGSSYLTIPTGREASGIVSVSRRSGTTSPVAVEIAQFPAKPRDHFGYELVKGALPLTVRDALSLDFPHFANGASMTSEVVIVNVSETPIQPTLYFSDREGDPISPPAVVDIRTDWSVQADASLTVRPGIAPLGELTVSTHGRGPLVTGSVRVLADSPIGGVLRFDSPEIGVAGVGTGFPSQDVIFPVRRQESAINTGAAIRNADQYPMTVTCQLMQHGQVLEEEEISLADHGQTAWFIDELFPATDTSDFVGSVRCTGPEGGLLTGVALEMDFNNPVFTTLPVVPVPPSQTQDYTRLHFAHFANGSSITSDLVFVNVAAGPIHPVIHFYDGAGRLIAPELVVDVGEGFQVRADGALTVQTDVAPLGELTISTHGRGDLVTGSVRVIADGPIGGFLRFDHPEVGVAGIGASLAVQDAIFPVRHQEGGIRTGAAIRSLEQDAIEITCQLMQGGRVLEEKKFPLESNGQTAQFIDELFPETVASDFVGSVRCHAPAGGRFTGLALEMDDDNRIFTTLPVVPVRR